MYVHVQINNKISCLFRRNNAFSGLEILYMYMLHSCRCIQPRFDKQKRNICPNSTCTYKYHACHTRTSHCLLILRMVGAVNQLRVTQPLAQPLAQPPTHQVLRFQLCMYSTIDLSGRLVGPDVINHSPTKGSIRLQCDHSSEIAILIFVFTEHTIFEFFCLFVQREVTIAAACYKYTMKNTT